MDYKLTQHPQINDVLIKFQNETVPFRKIHRMIDLFEIIIKTHTSFLIGTYFHYKNISDEVKGILAYGLRTPSLGTWHLFSRVIMEDLVLHYELTEAEYKDAQEALRGQQLEKFNNLYELKNGKYKLKKDLTNKDRKFLVDLGFNNLNFLCPDFLINDYCTYFYQWDSKMQSGKGNYDIIELRNKYAHGATPDDEDCSADIDRYSKVLSELISCPLFNDTTIASFKKSDGLIFPIGHEDPKSSFFSKVQLSRIQDKHNDIVEGYPYIIDKEGNMINMFPIMFYDRENLSINNYKLIFFNDLKKFKNKGEISYLNYPDAIKIQEKDIREDFLSIINIEEWKKISNNAFKDRIDELTETFKGRFLERKQIRETIYKNKQGFLMIYGKPGIGKSALIAKLVSDLENNKEKNSEESKIHIVEYFIKRGSSYAKPYKMLSYLNEKLESILPLGLRSEKILDIQMDEFETRLKMASELLVEKNEKLLLIFDGLDEGIDEDNNLLKYLPLDTYKNIFIIYTSRENIKVKEFYSILNREKRMEMLLSSLNKNEILSILYEAINKYELMDHEYYLDIISEKSQGNPLYLKLLTLSIESDEFKLDTGSLNNLPKNIDEFYDEFIMRFRKLKNYNLILDLLFIFASGKDYFTKKQLHLILGSNTVGIGDVENAVLDLLEVIQGSKYGDTNYKEEGYQLFHESFRQYLYLNYKDQIIDAEKKIMEYCRNWRQFINYSDSIIKYPLKYYSEHIRNLKEKELLYELIEDEDYLLNQISITNEYEYSLNMYKDGVMVAKEERNVEQILNIGQKVLKLYDSIDNNFEDILNSYENISISDFEILLGKIKLFEDKKRFILYLNLLDKVLKSETLLKDNIKIYAERIISDLDSYCPKNLETFNWNDFYPFYYMIDTLKCLYNLGISIEPISSRGIIKQNLFLDFNSDIEKNKFVRQIIEGFVFKEESSYGFMSCFDIDDFNLMKICYYLVENYDCKICIQILNKIKYYDNQLETIERIISILLKNKNHKDAVKFSKFISDDELKCKIDTKIACFLWENDSRPEALKLFNEMLEKLTLNIPRESDKASFVIKQLIIIVKSIGDLRLYKENPMLYNKILNLINLKQMDFIPVKVREGVCSDESQPLLLELYKVIAISIAKNGDYDKALSIINDSYSDLDHEVFSHDNEGEAFLQIAIILMKDKFHKEGYDLFEKAMKIFKEKSSFHLFMNSEKKNIIVDLYNLESKMLYEKLLEYIKSKDSDFCREDILAIADILLEINEYEEALRLQLELKSELDNIEEDYYGIKEHIRSSLSRAMVNSVIEMAVNCKYNEALKLIDYINEESDKTKAMVGIINSMIINGKYEEAISLFYEYLKVEEDSKLAYCNDEIIINLSRALTIGGKMDKALDLSENISHDLSKVKAKMLLNISIGERGDFKEALAQSDKIVDENMKGQVESSIHDLIIDKIENLARNGEFSNALELSNIMTDENSKLDGLLLIGAYMDYYGYSSESRDICSNVMKIAQSKLEHYNSNETDDVLGFGFVEKDNLLSYMAKSKALMGDYEDAVDLCKELFFRDKVKSFIYKIMVLKGDIVKAAELYKTIDEDIWKAKALNEFVKVLKIQDQEDEAKSFYPTIMSLTGIYENNSFLGETDILMDICKTMISAGEYKDGLFIGSNLSGLVIEGRWIRDYIYKKVEEKEDQIKILEILNNVFQWDKSFYLLTIIKNALSIKNLPYIIEIIDKEISHKENKIMCYKEIIENLDSVYKDIPLAISMIIPNILEDADLIRQCLNIYILYCRYILEDEHRFVF